MKEILGESLHCYEYYCIDINFITCMRIKRSTDGESTVYPDPTLVEKDLCFSAYTNESSFVSDHSLDLGEYNRYWIEVLPGRHLALQLGTWPCVLEKESFLMVCSRFLKCGTQGSRLSWAHPSSATLNWGHCICLKLSFLIFAIKEWYFVIIRCPHTAVTVSFSIHCFLCLVCRRRGATLFLFSVSLKLMVYAGACH